MPDLPVYKCIISEELDSKLQVDYIAMVDKPAIEKNFLAFNVQERKATVIEAKKMNFAVDAEKRIVSGPAMLADMLIYRNDQEGIGEYYAMFDAASIMSIVQKFFKKGYIQNFNLMHDPHAKTSGVTVFESYIVNRGRGINPPTGYEEVKCGSWFISAKVDDDAMWERVKTGEVKGFSVEGFFEQIPVEVTKMSATEALTQIQKLLKIADLAQ